MCSNVLAQRERKKKWKDFETNVAKVTLAMRRGLRQIWTAFFHVRERSLNNALTILFMKSRLPL